MPSEIDERDLQLTENRLLAHIERLSYQLDETVKDFEQYREQATRDAVEQSRQAANLSEKMEDLRVALNKLNDKLDTFSEVPAKVADIDRRLTFAETVAWTLRGLMAVAITIAGLGLVN